MTAITDDYMYEMLQKTKEYTIAILKPGPVADHPDTQKIIWEHGRRNFTLRSSGMMAIVCPVTIEANVSGICIFNVSPEDVIKIMDGDPAVEAGIFVYEVFPCRSFPGDCLPA